MGNECCGSDEVDEPETTVTSGIPHQISNIEQQLDRNRSSSLSVKRTNSTKTSDLLQESAPEFDSFKILSGSENTGLPTSPTSTTGAAVGSPTSAQAIAELELAYGYNMGISYLGRYAGNVALGSTWHHSIGGGTAIGQSAALEGAAMAALMENPATEESVGLKKASEWSSNICTEYRLNTASSNPDPETTTRAIESYTNLAEIGGSCPRPSTPFSDPIEEGTCNSTSYSPLKDLFSGDNFEGTFYPPLREPFEGGNAETNALTLDLSYSANASAMLNDNDNSISYAPAFQESTGVSGEADFENWNRLDSTTANTSDLTFETWNISETALGNSLWAGNVADFGTTRENTTSAFASIQGAEYS